MAKKEIDIHDPEAQQAKREFARHVVDEMESRVAPHDYPRESNRISERVAPHDYPREPQKECADCGFPDNLTKEEAAQALRNLHGLPGQLIMLGAAILVGMAVIVAILIKLMMG